MMRKWLWLGLLLLISFGIIASSQLLPRPAPVSYTQIVTPQKRQLVNIPSVNSGQLFTHVKQLNFERYTEKSRSRTRNYLINSLKKFGWTPKTQTFAGGINILAQKQGLNPNAGAILIAAHYDTVAGSPGADDNASGVAVVLEIARLFNRISTPRTLQIAFFDLEEEGLLGSLAYAANQTFVKDLRGVIVLDMVGYACYTAGCQKYPSGLPIVPPTDKGDFLAAVGDMEHAPLLAAVQQTKLLPPVFTLPVPLKGMLIPDTLRSDHAPFWYQGIGAVLLTDTANLRSPHYHQPSDRPETLDKKFFTGVAQIVVNSTYKLLQRSDRLSTPIAPVE